MQGGYTFVHESNIDFPIFLLFFDPEFPILLSQSLECYKSVDDIIQTHATTLEDVFDIKLQQKEKSLPQIYWPS